MARTRFSPMTQNPTRKRRSSKILACPLNPPTPVRARSCTNNSDRSISTISPLITSNQFKSVSNPTSSKSARISKKSRNTSMTPEFRPPACGPSSKPTVKFSPSPPKREIFATSPIPRASPTAARPGLPTEKPSPTFPTSPANTRCTCARKTVWAKSAKSISVFRRPFSTASPGRPTARKSLTPTNGSISGTWIWTNPLPVKVDTDYYDAQGLSPAWSPDNRWIAYTKQLPSHFRAVFVYSLDTGKSTQITDGMSDTRFAVFDKNGKYLYFAASTNSGPAIGGLDMSSDGKQVTRSVYVIVLRKDLPSPLAPESDEEKPATDKKDADNSKTLPSPNRINRTTTRNRIRTRAVTKATTKIKSQSKSPLISTTSASASWRFPSLPRIMWTYLPARPVSFSLSNFRPPRIPKARQAWSSQNSISQNVNPSNSSPASRTPPSLSTAKNSCYQQGENWFIAPTAAAREARRRRAQTRLHGSLGRAPRRMETDVRRNLAHRTRFLLRPASSRRESAGPCERI